MDENNSIRRRLLKAIISTPALVAPVFLNLQQADAKQKSQVTVGHKNKVSLNAYSFNEPLRNGSMTLDHLLEFCADTGFDAVDVTGYYFPGYPTAPADEYIYHIKR